MMKPMQATGPTYYVEPAYGNQAGHWRVLRVDHGANTGTVIATHYKSRQQAKTAASLLAGRSGSVVVVKGRASTNG
jgi:hypothetical protein